MKNLTSHYFDTLVKSLCFIHYLDVVVIWYLYGFLGVIFVFPCPLRGLTWDCGAQVRKERALHFSGQQAAASGWKFPGWWLDSSYLPVDPFQKRWCLGNQNHSVTAMVEPAGQPTFGNPQNRIHLTAKIPFDIHATFLSVESLNINEMRQQMWHVWESCLVWVEG